jgi:hypothetical protein
MEESDINRIFANSLKAKNGAAYKIPDPNAGFSTTVKRCFDGIGSFKINDKFYPLYWEGKWSKNFNGLNFKEKIEPHQAAYLDSFRTIENAITLIIYGVIAERGDKRIYVFDWNFFRSFYYSEEKNNITKKQLKDLPYFKIDNKLGLIDFNYENIIKSI